MSGCISTAELTKAAVADHKKRSGKGAAAVGMAMMGAHAQRSPWLGRCEHVNEHVNNTFPILPSRSRNANQRNVPWIRESPKGKRVTMSGRSLAMPPPAAQYSTCNCRVTHHLLVLVRLWERGWAALAMSPSEAERMA